ncbi:MAG TPA: PilN domain-containing protein [Deltaproteobacteria bacterium]|nr:PilN domain-containing protein [Deltaproteobacteria bacterium]
MRRYSVGIYWDNVSLHACLIKVGEPELTIERFISMPREYDEKFTPTKSISEEIPELLREARIEPFDTCVVGVPESETMHRSLLRPFGDRKKIAQTIGPEVETLLPILDGGIIVDYVLLGKDEAGLHRVETISVRRSSIENLVSEMKSSGIDPEIIDSPCASILAGARQVFRLHGHATYLFLHMGWRDTSLTALQGTEVRYVGVFPYGFEKIATCALGEAAKDPQTMEKKLREGIEAGRLLDAAIREVLIALSRIDSTSHDYVLVPAGYACSIKDLSDRFTAASDISTDLPERNPVRTDADLDTMLRNFMPLSLACRGIDSTDAVNFRKGDLGFTKKIEWLKGYAGAWTKVAAVFVILWLFGLGLNISLNAKTSHQLTKLIAKEFSTVMPGGTPMVDPVKQMEQHLARLSARDGGASGGAATPLEIMRDLSAGIPRNIDVLLDNIFIDENSITITGSAATYDNVERMKESLSALSYIEGVKIVSANVDKNDQRVRLKLVCDKKSNNT